MAERHWVEVNSRVNYPLKRALVMMEENKLINMDCTTTKFCVLFFTKAVAQFGIQQHIDSWNHHTIPGMSSFQYTKIHSMLLQYLCVAKVSYYSLCLIGKGIPNQLATTNNRASILDRSLIPSTASAISLFQRSGGQLSVPSEFGADPLNGHSELMDERTTCRLMDNNRPSIEHIFSCVEINSCQEFVSSLQYMIDETNHLVRFC